MPSPLGGRSPAPRGAPAPGESPETAVIAISATNLRMTGPQAKSPGWHAARSYDWLAHQRPLAQIGDSIFVYPVTREPDR